MYYDSHTHLNDIKIFDKWESLLKKFIDSWWKWLINVWVDENRNDRAIFLVKNSVKYQDKCFIWATIWYHPSEVCYNKINKNNIKSKIDNLIKSYDKNKNYIVWIWECWIDTHYENGNETIVLQKELFDLHCNIAKQNNLPIVVHSRDDFESTFDVLKTYKNLKIYFHCWGYWPDEIKKIQNYFTNIWIWYAWNITYPKAELLRQSFAVTDIENLLMETDAPYLSPQNKRWETNEPLNIIDIYNYCSNLKNMNTVSYNIQIEKNFKKLYMN